MRIASTAFWTFSRMKAIGVWESASRLPHMLSNSIPTLNDDELVTRFPPCPQGLQTP